MQEQFAEDVLYVSSARTRRRDYRHGSRGTPLRGVALCREGHDCMDAGDRANQEVSAEESENGVSQKSRW
jgi:hypothetical protein